MESVVGDIFFIILLVFSFIEGPIYNSFNESDTYINNYVKSAINSYQKQVRDNGYVDIDTYNKFLNKINRTKEVYKIQLTHSSKLVYPNGTNDFKTVNVKHGNKEILSTICKGQKYYMKYGDDFHIALKETKIENSKIVKSALYILQNSDNALLTFANGGMVENEVN